MLVLRAECLDLWRNLAAEEYLLDRAGSLGPVLFFWRTGSAVVVGKNQNPWAECPLGRLERDGTRLGRRVSGGGAVFQDEGNLNYAFFLPRRDHAPDDVYRVLLAGLERVGIVARLSGRNLVDERGRKFSGNAFCYRRDILLHHGTLLVAADLQRLGNSLAPSLRIVGSRAVASRPAEVANLRDLRRGLTVEGLAEAVAASAAEMFGTAGLAGEDVLDNADVKALRERHASWDWIYGRTPVFTAELAAEAGGDVLSLNVEVKAGRVQRVVPAGGAFAAEHARRVEEALRGSPFRAPALAEKLERLGGETGDEPVRRLAAWMAKQTF